MKTRDVPAIVMLLAGGLYCLLGIYYQIPLLDFTIQLLSVLLIFWIIGGILRMILDRFMGEVKVKDAKETEEDEENEAEETKADKNIEKDKQAAKK